MGDVQGCEWDVQGCEWDVHVCGCIGCAHGWVGRGVSGMYVRTCVQ